MLLSSFSYPEYMYSHFNSVRNPEVYMDFTRYGFGKVLANSEKYVKNMREFRQLQEERAAKQASAGSGDGENP